MTEILSHALVTFVVVIDPIGVAAIYAAMTAAHDWRDRRRMAIRGTVIAAGVLILFGLGGDVLLRALGVSIAAFRIAGGTLLLLTAIDMVFARQTGLRSVTSSEDAEARRKDDVSVFPLAIPLIAGPGAIASLLLLLERAGGDVAREVGVLAVLLLVLGASLVCLLAAARVVAVLGVTGTNVVGRVLGLVLAALAVQFILDGLRQAGVF